jgi:hypothetical protein
MDTPEMARIDRQHGVAAENEFRGASVIVLMA